jgi:hypothetical protein
MTTFALVSGVPRAGKSSLCDAVEASGAGFTHVPLDRYVRPVPGAHAFLDWIASPTCIDWDRLLAHLAVLEAGVPCYSPRPDWEGGWRGWISDGGPLDAGPGRRMAPARVGYLIAGTHAFAFPAGGRAAIRVFVASPDFVVAERLTGERVDPARARAIVRARLAPNTAAIRRGARNADLVVDGTAERPAQVRRFLDAHARLVPGWPPPARAEPGVPADETSKPSGLHRRSSPALGTIPTRLQRSPTARALPEPLACHHPSLSADC